MNGLMMDMPLSIASIVEHAERVNGDAQIVSITAENPRHRYTYREAFSRARKLGDRLLLFLSQWFQPLSHLPRRAKAFFLAAEFQHLFDRGEG